VFFDNLQVTHIRGPLIEETHYYPFGLTMSGISSRALEFGNPENKRKYNGIEKENDLQIEIYEAQLRELDVQVGRWWQIDPKIENMEMWSPYVSNYDNAVRYSDPRGDEGEDCCSWLSNAARWVADRFMTSVNNEMDALKGAVDQAGKNFRARKEAGEFTFSRIVEKAGITDFSSISMGPVSLVGLEAKSASLEARMLKTVDETAELTKSAGSKVLEKYEVGTYNSLREKSVVGDGLDLHHVPQSQPASQLIPRYSRSTAPTIALPEAERHLLPKFKGTTTAGSARAQLAKDIVDLRRHTNAPNSRLQQLIDMSKKMYPEYFRKTTF